MKIPNSVQAFRAYSWMKAYFDLVGETTPKSDIIQLEYRLVKDVYNEFIDHEESCGHPQATDPICYETFGKLWQLCFSHVRIRQYKQVRIFKV